MVYKSPKKKKTKNKKQKTKQKQKMLVSQILDNFDIDEKSLHGYVRDNYQMNLTIHLITCAW